MPPDEGEEDCVSDALSNEQVRHQFDRTIQLDGGQSHDVTGQPRSVIHDSGRQ